MASWDSGVVCTLADVTQNATSASNRKVLVVNRLKPTSTEVDNAILLSPTCDDEGSGTRLTEPVPPIGHASLPADALARGVLSGSMPNDKAVPRSRLEAVRAKLQAGERVHILLIGSSNSALFGSICRDGCRCDGPESEAIVRERFDRQAQRVYSWSQADWFSRFIQTLHRRYPQADIVAQSSGYGGLSPMSVASCPSDFLEGLAAFDPRKLGDVHDSSSSETSKPTRPDLLVLDFAVYAGFVPDSRYIDAFEKLLRYLWPTSTAVLFLNLGNFCRGANGTVSDDVMGHAKCQRMLFDGYASAANIGRATFPDPWHERLGQLAVHYGHSAVSMFDALQPLIASQAIKISEITQDGMHPTYWPRRSNLARVYVTYTADALAYAVDPTSVTHHNGIWNGRRRDVKDAARVARMKEVGREADAITATRFRSANRRHSVRATTTNLTRLPVATVSQLVLPHSLVADVDDVTGMRCYGWVGYGGARGNEHRGSWFAPGFLLEGVSLQGHYSTAWAYTESEVVYSLQANGWVPNPKPAKKAGLTSVTPGDRLIMKVDTSFSFKSNDSHLAPALQIMYLRSYEQTGILKIECTSGCRCTPWQIDTLEPKRRFATLDTAMSPPISRARSCMLAFTNISPHPRGGVPRTKLKIVSIAVVAKRYEKPVVFDTNV